MIRPGSAYESLTCSVDTSRGHGVSKGGDFSCFRCLQLCNCFHFNWGWGGRLREGGWEHVLALLDTSENTGDKHENTEDIHSLLREKRTSRLWSFALWESWAGQREDSEHKLLHHRGDCTEQTAIMNQLLVVLKDTFLFLKRGLNNARFQKTGKLICPIEVSGFCCHKQCVKAKIPGKVYFETFRTFLPESNMSNYQLGLIFYFSFDTES